jgi:hypothetical protein
MGAEGAGAMTGVTTGAGTTTDVPAASASVSLVRMLLMCHWRRILAALRKSSTDRRMGRWIQSKGRQPLPNLVCNVCKLQSEELGPAEIQVVALQKRELGNS